MTNELLKVIAFDYYDGATEGVVNLLDGVWSYFHLVAWDSGQDERLYAVLDIPRSEAGRIFSILDPPSCPEIWLPDWTSISQESNLAIERLIEAWKQRVLDAGYLILSGDVIAPARRRFDICSEHRAQLQLSLRLNSPGNLADFRSMSV